MIQVQRKINSLIVGQFLGFKGNDTVVVATNESTNEYTFDQFERLFKFTSDSDKQQYEKIKDEVLNDETTHQVNEEQLEELLKEAIEKNNVAKQLEKEKRQEQLNEEQNKKNTQKQSRNTQQSKQPKEKPQGEILKEKYLYEVLTQQPFFNDLNSLICKDGTVSYMYRGVTIFQIKGKRKVYCYFTGKMFDENFLKEFMITPEKYKATHNAYLILEDESQFAQITKAIETSIQYVDNKKGPEKQQEQQEEVEHNNQQDVEQSVEETQETLESEESNVEEVTE